MKYSVPNRVSKKYLKKANEIKIQKSDFRKTLDYIKDYPNAEIVLCISGEYPAEDLWIEEKEIQVTLAELEKFNSEGEGRFSVEIETINSFMIDWFKNKNIPFFWKYPIITFDELQALQDLGASQVLIDGPLFFQLKDVSVFKIPVRIIPNVCYEGYLPRKNGLHGTWMRPQDQELYEPYITTLEFKEENNKKWEALFDIYSKDKNYFGDLNILFKNFNFPNVVFAAAIPDTIIEDRLHCKQRCTQNRCSLCDKGLETGLRIQQQEIARINITN